MRDEPAEPDELDEPPPVDCDDVPEGERSDPDATTGVPADVSTGAGDTAAGATAALGALVATVVGATVEAT